MAVISLSKGVCCGINYHYGRCVEVFPLCTDCSSGAVTAAEVERKELFNAQVCNEQ